MKNTTKFDIGYTVAMFLIVLLAVIILAYQLTSGTLTNERFFTVYMSLGLVSLVYLMGATLFNVMRRARQTDEADLVVSANYVSHTTRIRLLSHPFARLITLIAVAALVTLTVVGAGSIVNVPNPYGAEPVTQSILENNPTFWNFWNISVYPGLFEEIAIFALVNILIVMFTSVASLLFFKSIDERYNLLIFIPMSVIAVLIGAWVFMFAHNTAFGLDTEAKTKAYVFEAAMQSMNQLTGTILSWIPHALHNGIVTFKTQFALAVGGLASITPPFLLLPIAMRTYYQSLLLQYRRDRQVFEVARWMNN